MGSSAGCSPTPRLVAQSIIVAVLFSLISLASGEHGGCPTQCLCYVDDNGLRTANCTGVEFISFGGYSKLFSDIEVLNIRPHNNKPVKLSDDMFLYFIKLKHLNLSNCRIRNIPKNTFKGLKKIWEINLSDNEIQHFHSSVFENIYDLSRLSLRGNPLQISPKPYIISNLLKELDIGNCGISVLQNEFFHGLKRVTHLYLDGNYLQTIKEHVLPRGLTYLNLAYNKFVNIPIDVISSLNQLRRLDLNGNRINCTCPVLNLQDWLSGHGVTIDGDVRCAYPAELENISWSKVNENEVCNKEIFSEKAHFRKSQNSKYIHQKKDNYFENEKYGSYESLQGDQPDEADYSGEQTNYDNDSVEGSKGKGAAETETEDPSKQGVEDAATPAPNTEKDHLEEVEHVQVNPENLEEHSALKASNDSAAPPTEGEENTLDENVSLVQENADGKVNDTAEDEPKVGEKADVLNKTEGGLEESTNDTEHDASAKDELKNDGDKEADNGDHDTKSENVNGSNELGDGENGEVSISQLDIGKAVANDADNSSKEIEVLPEKLARVSDAEQENSTDDDGDKAKLAATTPLHAEHGDRHSLFEGSGSEGEETETPSLGENITFDPNPEVVEDDSPAYIEPNIAIYDPKPDGELKVAPVDAERADEEAKDQSLETQKRPLEYQAMGQYIVVALIGVVVAVLLLFSVYRGCKSKSKRQPAPDVEAPGGTELQDMASLIPKPQAKEEKNGKYPDEPASPETVKLINGDGRADATRDPTDLNQNASSKNDPIVKNGKPTEGVGPVEITKAKLTVLLDSIPRTPVFVQKRSPQV